MKNDTDADGDALTAVLDQPPATGRLTLYPDGSFVYRPRTGFKGKVTFTYRAFDGIAFSDPVVVTILVKAPVPPPVLFNVP